MKRKVREFLEQEEATAAARSKEAKRQKRRKFSERFARFLVEKAEKIEANGNPAGAEQFRKFWRSFPAYRTAFPKANVGEDTING